MRRSSLGFTLLELLVVMAILGVLASVGYAAWPRDRIQVNQAVEELARTVERARFTSVEGNEFVWVELDSSAQTLELRGQDSADDDAGSHQIAIMDFGAEDVSLRSIEFEFELTEASPVRMLFDPRGVGHGIVANGAYVSEGYVTITVGHVGTRYSRNVDLNQYGRAVIQ